MLEQKLTTIFNSLFGKYGSQHWWPAESPFEVILGAILTQATTWQNVEKTIINLKYSDLLNATALRTIPEKALARLLYSCGYYNAKAKKLKSFADYLGKFYNDNLLDFFSKSTKDLRSELLSIHGIGYETADSIILYAAKKPIFVVDAYTRRIFIRIGLIDQSLSYQDIQLLFMENLPHDEKLFNEYHALLVQHGKQVCKTSPICDQCCLIDICQF